MPTCGSHDINSPDLSFAYLDERKPPPSLSNKNEQQTSLWPKHVVRDVVLGLILSTSGGIALANGCEKIIYGSAPQSPPASLQKK